MKSTVVTSVVGLILFVSAPALANEEGRFQGFMHPDGGGLYILDTQEGHVWNLETDELTYLGQCLVGGGGETISEPSTGEEMGEEGITFDMLLKSYEEWNK